MTVTMLDAALEYASRGLSVFPCSAGSKSPFSNTNGSKDATTDERQIREWWTRSPTANVAIATGSVSGIYAVDIDAESDPIMARLPQTWMARTRGGGWHYIYRLPDGVVLKNTTKDSAEKPNARSLGHAVDSRGEGGYILVFPSVVDGKPYAWVNDIEPVEIPQWIVDKVKTVVEVAMTTRSTFAMVSTSWANKALDEECYSVSSTPKGGRHTALVRASFKTGQLVGGGHLSQSTAQAELEGALSGFSLAPGERRHALTTIRKCLQAGIAAPRHPQHREHVDPFGGLDITMGDFEADSAEVLAPTVKEKKPNGDAHRWALLNSVRELGGLCDSYTAWVVRGADHPQPGLTLASLLALGSVLAGRTLVYRRSLSSLYVVSLAASAEGKNRPQACLGRVLDECWPVLAGANSFSSGPAFTDGVRKSVENGVGTCLVLDEYGMQLANMCGPRAATHRQDIKQCLTELSTKGTDKWSPALSLVKGGGKLELWAPSVTILGSTTPDSLHAVLTSTDVADGFVGRHVWFRAQDVLPMWQAPEDRGDDAIPIDVRSALLAMRQQHEEWQMGLTVTADTGLDVLRLYDPQHVTETDEAKRLLLEHKLKCDDDRRLQRRADIPNAVLGRMPEFAARMALILAALSQPERVVPVVGEMEATVAIALADESAMTFAASLTAGRRPRWDDHEAQLDLVVGVIRDEGGATTKTELMRRCRRLSGRQIDEVLARLAEEGTIEVLKIASSGGRPAFGIRLVQY